MLRNERSGVIAAGNYIVDHIKTIDEYPAQDHLAVVLSEAQYNGGGPYNLLRDLVALGVDFPLYAEGLVGDDRDGHWILEDCEHHGIDTSGLRMSPDVSTSWTDVMSVASTGRRTFFHRPGANDDLTLGSSEILSSSSKIFYLGYLTMLGALDARDADGRTLASRVLEGAGDAGMTTVADLVSRKHPQFRTIVESAAPYLDYLILNEIEADWLLERVSDGLAKTFSELEIVAREILELGIRRAVVLHFEFGAVCVGAGGASHAQAAVNLPQSMIRSKVGAGDAFAAGFLLGLHGEQGPATSLRYAVTAAASCITAVSSSDGIKSLQECLELAEAHGFHAREA